MPTPSRTEIENLFRRHGKGVGSYLLSRVRDAELAEEITACVFLKVVRLREQCRSSLVAWMWSIVRSELARHFRARRAHGDLDDEIAGADEEPGADLELRESCDQLSGAVASLPDLEREVVELRLLLGLKHREIAEIVDRTPGNVSVILHRALRRLRGTLADSSRN